MSDVPPSSGQDPNFVIVLNDRHGSREFHNEENSEVAVPFKTKTYSLLKATQCVVLDQSVDLF